MVPVYRHAENLNFESGLTKFNF